MNEIKNICFHTILKAGTNGGAFKMPYFCQLATSSKLRTQNIFRLGKTSKMYIGFLVALTKRRNTPKVLFKLVFFFFFSLYKKKYLNFFSQGQNYRKSRTRKLVNKQFIIF